MCLSFRPSMHSSFQILQHQLPSINYGCHEYTLLIASVKHIYPFVPMLLVCLIFVSMLLLSCIRISFWRTCISQRLSNSNKPFHQLPEILVVLQKHILHLSNCYHTFSFSMFAWRSYRCWCQYLVVWGKNILCQTIILDK